MAKKNASARPVAREGMFEAMGFRLAPVDEVNENARTVDVTFTTGAAVRRRDFWTGEEWDEELRVDESSVDLNRLNSGAAVLDSHNRWETDAIRAVVDRAWIEGGKGRATLRFPAAGVRASADEMLALIRERIIQNVSVGYATHKAEWDRSGPVAKRIATRWEPVEISFVTVGADAGAGTRAHVPVFACEIVEKPMAENRTPAPGTESPEERIQTPAPTPTPTPTPAPTPAPGSDTDSTRAIASERVRASTIRARVRASGLPEDVADRVVATGVEIEHLNPMIANELASRGTQNPIRTPPGGLDAIDTMRAGIAEALLNRFNASAFPLSDRGRQYRGMRLMELARFVVEQQGERTLGLAPLQIADRAMTTSDFPLIVANIANKTLQAGYAAEVRTFLPFCTRNDLPDFKITQSTMMGEGSDLDLVNEHGEFTVGAIGEGAEQWQLATYGKIFSLTRQLLLNDDMGAFTRLPYMFGQAAARKENDIVWGILTTNANMSDGIALFQAASHLNLQTGGGSVLAAASLGVMRTNLRKQKGLDGKQTLNLLLKFIAVPAALEGTLEQIMSPLLYAQTTSTIVAQFYRGLVPIVEARLDANSVTAFYGFCDPAQMPTIDYGYLQGQDGVFLETKEGWRVDGVEIKVRHDFGAKAVNHRGMQKSAGA